MRKNWPLPLSVIVFLLLSFAGEAQQKSYESQVSYQKGQQLATIWALPYPEDVVESSIKDYMSRKGLKPSNSRGYMVFRNVRLEDTATSLNDLHIRVDRKSSKEKDASVVTVLVARPGEDPSARMGRDDLAQRRTATYVENMLPGIQAGDLETRIKSQESVTKKSQNKLGDLHDDQGDLEKKIKNTQADIDKNKQDQVTETTIMQQNIHGDDAAMKKSHKKMDKLLSDQTSLQKKLAKYQAQLEQNKKDQGTQQSDALQQQHSLDSLRSMRKN